MNMLTYPIKKPVTCLLHTNNVRFYLKTMLLILIHTGKYPRYLKNFDGPSVDVAKWKCVIFKCYSSEKLITLNILHEVVPTWYSFHSWVDWSNADKVSCSRKQHTAAGVRTVYLCIQNRHSSQPTNMLQNSLSEMFKYKIQCLCWRN